MEEDLAGMETSTGCDPIREVSSFQRCPHFRGVKCRDLSLLERCPHFRGCYVQGWDTRCIPIIIEVSSHHREVIVQSRHY